jgi:hypothetical protein
MTSKIDRSDPAYARVTNWSLVHDLIKACVAASNGDLSLIEPALAAVDDAHTTNAKHRVAVAFFTDEMDRGDDTNGDGDCPLISLNEGEGDEVDGIWISHCSYVDLTSEENEDAPE